VPGVEVTIRNTGKRYAMMAGATWTIQGKGADGKPLKVVLNSNDMGRLLGAGYVPALNGRRTFDVPTGTKFANAPITVKFSN
jgi:fimbrial chaperone protein